MSNLRPARLAALSLVLILPGLASAASNKKSDDDDHIEIKLGKAGAELRTDTQPSELGIAVFPGAVRDVNKKGESDSVSLGLWGEESGFHLALIKYRTDAPVGEVTRFYLKELGRFGPVTTCLGGVDGGDACGDLGISHGDVELHAGPEKDRRLVAISSKDGHTELVILRLQQPSK